MEELLDQVCTDVAHNLYIRMLAGPSPKLCFFLPCMYKFYIGKDTRNLLGNNIVILYEIYHYSSHPYESICLKAIALLLPSILYCFKLAVPVQAGYFSNSLGEVRGDSLGVVS